MSIEVRPYGKGSAGVFRAGDAVVGAWYEFWWGKAPGFHVLLRTGAGFVGIEGRHLKGMSVHDAVRLAVAGPVEDPDGASRTFGRVVSAWAVDEAYSFSLRTHGTKPLGYPSMVSAETLLGRRRGDVTLVDRKMAVPAVRRFLATLDQRALAHVSAAERIHDVRAHEAYASMDATLALPGRDGICPSRSSTLG